MYALADCNNFFVSCERVFNPTLNNKPVVVLSNNDGCAIARSNEAKALGIPMGCPAFQIKNYTTEHVIMLSAQHVLYRDISNRIMFIASSIYPSFTCITLSPLFSFISIRRFTNT